MAKKQIRALIDKPGFLSTNLVALVVGVIAGIFASRADNYLRAKGL